MTPNLPALNTRASFAKGLAKCVEKYGFTKIGAFVFDLPFTDTTIKVWLKQTQAPILGSLLEICFRLNKRLSDFMLPSHDPDEGTEDITLEQHTSQSGYAANTATPKGPADWDIVKTELRKATTELPPPPLSKLAKNLRRNATTLKRKFPELTTSIIERSRNYYHPPLDEELAEQTLTSACSENPPPSLTDIARRLERTGGISILRMRFPELCRKIVERWRAERKRVLNYEEIEKQLRAILEENPPPSFVTVTKRLNISRGLLATKFRELSAMISSRFIAHRRVMKESRNAVLAEEVPRICRDLFAEGLYPSYKRVAARLSRGGLCEVSEALRLQTIKELKSE
jgi:AraC-like DNA-binding protein